MSIPRIAPVFVLTVPGPADQTRDRLHALMHKDAGPFTGSAAGNHMTLTVREKDRHFWSPWLHLEVEEADGQTRVRGRFTPHPSVWTGFAFAYFGLIVLASFAAIWGMSQWMLQEQPTALWVALGCGVIVGLLWWAAQIGQKLAREQMERLRNAVEGTVGADATSRAAL